MRCPLSEMNGLRGSNHPPFTPPRCPFISDNGHLVGHYPLIILQICFDHSSIQNLHYNNRCADFQASHTHIVNYSTNEAKRILPINNKDAILILEKQTFSGLWLCHDILTKTINTYHEQRQIKKKCGIMEGKRISQ